MTKYAWMVNSFQRSIRFIHSVLLDRYSNTYWNTVLSGCMHYPSYKKIPLTSKTVQMARLLELAGDQTRLRILCFMFKYRKACVSDIAESLDMNITTVSHHLQIMRDNGYFETERMGNKICYHLVENTFTKLLKKLVCG